MKPVEHSATNKFLPGGHGGRDPLPVTVSGGGPGVTIMASAWVPTEAERERLARAEAPYISLVFMMAATGEVSFSMSVGEAILCDEEDGGGGSNAHHSPTNNRE